MNKANNLQAIFIVHISYIPIFYVEKKKNTEKKREREGKVSVSYKNRCKRKYFFEKKSAGIKFLSINCFLNLGCIFSLS